MAMIPDKSVDLIVIDPPYNIGKDKRWDKWETVEAYVSWLRDVFKECARVLKDTGSFYWFHNDMTQIWRLMQTIETETNFVYKQLIVWNKRFEGASNKGFLDGFIEVGGLRNYQQMAEYCLFYTLQEDTGLKNAFNHATFINIGEYFKEEREKSGLTKTKCDEIMGVKSSYYIWENTKIDGHHTVRIPRRELYEALQTTGYWKKPYETLKEEYELLRLNNENLRYTYNNLKTHHSVWNYEVAPKHGHITPKPVEMIENIIRHSSNEGDIVLDCFMGSGTTAVAAARLGRNFIGFERESEYVQIANQRLEAIQDEMAERKLTE
jgi:DNA modification methylase